MRVLVVTPPLPTPDDPGSMAPAARQIRSLAGLGITTDVLEMRGIARLKYAHGFFRLRKRLAGVDLIHAHFGYCGWLSRMQAQRPIVLSFMGSDLLGTPRGDGRLKWFSRMMIRANCRLAPHIDQVIVKSDELARVIAPTPAHVIPNGVDTELFCPIDRNIARRQLKWPMDAPRVLFPGNPADPRKGLALARQGIKVASRAMRCDLELVPLWGVAPDDVPLYMNACDAMLMTSLLEGSPNVVKEAMACNLPVIGVPVGDVEQLLGGVAGCHVCPRDAEQLGQQLAATLSRCEAAGGRQAIIQRGLDLTSVARRIVDVFELALTGAGMSARCQSAQSVHSEPAVPATL